MSDSHDHNADYASGTGYEPDLSDKVSGIIFAWIAVLTVLFFITLGALVPYFKWEAEREMSKKVFTAESAELNELRKEEATGLTGIDKAMTAVAAEGK